MESSLENVAQMPQCQATMLIMSLFVSQGKRKEIKCLNIQWAPSTQALQTFDSRAIAETTQIAEMAKQIHVLGAFFFNLYFLCLLKQIS